MERESLYYSMDEDKVFIGENSKITIEKKDDSIVINGQKESIEINHMDMMSLINSFWPINDKTTRTKMLVDTLNRNYKLVDNDMQALIEISRIEGILNEKISQFKSKYAIQSQEWKDFKQTV